MAAIGAEQDKTSAAVAALNALANTRLDQAITSPAAGIGFLGDVLEALHAVQAGTGTIPPELTQPVTNVVLGAFNFAAPVLTITDLNQMIALKHKIAEIFTPSAPAVPVAVGGIQ